MGTQRHRHRRNRRISTGHHRSPFRFVRFPRFDQILRTIRDIRFRPDPTLHSNRNVRHRRPHRRSWHRLFRHRHILTTTSSIEIRNPSRRRGLITAIGILVALNSVTIGIGLPAEGRGNPFPLNQDSVDMGLATYTTSCSTCHGETGLGDGPAGLALNPPPADLAIHVPLHTDDELYSFIADGIEGTPMVAQLGTSPPTRSGTSSTTSGQWRNDSTRLRLVQRAIRLDQLCITRKSGPLNDLLVDSSLSRRCECSRAGATEQAVQLDWMHEDCRRVRACVSDFSGARRARRPLIHNQLLT